MGDFFGDQQAGPSNLSFAQYNPFFGRGAGRNVLQLSFDDSIDASHPLECYFVMPDRTRAIRSAQVWVQTKPFRQYVSASSSSGSGGAHSHAFGQAQTSNIYTTAGPSATMADHSHVDGGGFNTTGANPIISNTYNGHTHAHSALSVTGISNDSPAHTHTITTTLTAGIYETAASGTVALFVADDGVTYDATHPIVSGVAVATGITKQDILATPSGGSATSHLTKAAGNKRIKITGTALMRVQVLIVLDLKLSVF
jgi:hypothetical protein